MCMAALSQVPQTEQNSLEEEHRQEAGSRQEGAASCEVATQTQGHRALTAHAGKELDAHAVAG